MSFFSVSAIVLSATALGGYINSRWVKLPSSISLLLFSMGISLIGLFLKQIYPYNIEFLHKLLSSINFKEVIFHGVLSFILFAGAMQINIEDLKKTKIAVITTAFISTFVSTILIGIAFFYIANYLSFNINLAEAMLFGAILSPTDPIAVLSIIKGMKAPKLIETTIVGESLFNDGIAIVLFLTILEMIDPEKEIGIGNVILFTFQEIGGGLIFGGMLGMLASKMLSQVKEFESQLLITLAVVTGGYALAENLGFSAPLAMVVAGIILGNRKTTNGATHQIKQYLDLFWEAIDNVLNASLFFLMGMEMLVINTNTNLTLLSLACIPTALIARYISIAVPLNVIKPFHIEPKGTSVILTWGGLRGALSIAMVLSLASENMRSIFLPCIYYVVIFSIAVQGLTFNKVLKTYLKNYSHKK
jgi:CPA1 family monovalent cation:H+ antiporter